MKTTAIILIVDDIESNRETLRELLDNEAYKIIEAANGPAALQLAAESPPDLVLLDVMMPGMDGYEVCRRLRAHSRLAEVPVVMVTALDDLASRVTGIEAGADDFITKPINRTEMRARVRTITRLNRYRRLIESQTQLHASENRFRALFEMGPLGIYSCDTSGAILDFNRRAVELWGWTPEKGTNYEPYCGSHKLYHPDGVSMPRDQCPMAMVVTGKLPVADGQEILIERPDGSRISALTNIEPLHNERGETIGAINCFYDITERKQTEAALRESDERFQLMIESVKDYAIIMLDEGGRIVSWNAGAKRIKGYEAKEIVGQHFSRFYPKEDIKSGRPEQALQIATKEGRYEEEGLRMRKDGSRFIANVVITPLFDHKGGLRGFAKVTRDVSERARANAALRESEERLRLTLDSAQMGTFDWDMQRDRLTWSRRHEELWGIVPGQFGGTFKTFSDCMHSEDVPGINTVIARCIAGREQFVYEFRVVWPDASVHWISASGNFEYDAGGIPARMRGTVMEITARKQTEAALHKAEDQLRQSQKMDAIGQLAGGVAHDFNNQLNIILGYGDLLKARVDQPKLKQYAERICSAANRSAELTKQLLAFAHKGQYQSTPLHVQEIIAETVEMLDRTIDKRIEIKQLFNTTSDLVLGDPSQLQNAFLNLGVNARDAMPAGGCLLFETENVEINAEFVASHGEGIQVGHYVKISVSDTGSGMTDEVKKHVFEPFFTTKPVGKGTGLGLASVYGTVKNHKGTLNVYSEVGRGTAIRIYLPLVAQPAANEPPMTNHDQSVAQLKAVKNLCVLLVEDEEILRNLVADMLGASGIDYLEGENGRHAVEMYKQHWQHIDIVILDMIMPEMDGPDAFRAMKKINPGVKVLIATGFSLNNEIQAVLDDGVLGYIQKPFVKKDLLKMIIAVMG